MSTNHNVQLEYRVANLEAQVKELQKFHDARIEEEATAIAKGINVIVLGLVLLSVGLIIKGVTL